MLALPSIAQSGLQAAQARLGASAHNIANMQTDGFKRETVSAQPSPQGGVVVSISQAAQPGVDLNQEVVDQLGAKNAFMANVQVLRTADQMVGSLLDVRA